MSYVTDVVVHLEYAPPEVENLLTEPFPFEQTRKGAHLWRMRIDEVGGSKAFEGDIYAGAFNYLDVDALVEWFVNLPWGEVGDAVLSTYTEGELHRVVVLRDGKLTDDLSD